MRPPVRESFWLRVWAARLAWITDGINELGRAAEEAYR